LGCIADFGDTSVLGELWRESSIGFN